MSVPARNQATLDVLRERSVAVRRFELPIQRFIHTEGMSGWLLLATAAVALVWANSPFQSSYFHFWEAEISFNLGLLHLEKTLHHWINDGLMAIFFLLVGMEIKHELVSGYLRTRKQAMLPVAAAVGGMIAPAMIYLAFNAGGAGLRGWGIPMATDIAFALAVLAMVKGIPVELKVFLLALAIVDDIGAIIVIALFYTESLRLFPLLIGVCLLLGIWALRSIHVQLEFPYIILGILFWVAILRSGIHATVAGVILGFMVRSKPLVDHQSFTEEASNALEAMKIAVRRGDEREMNANLGTIEAMANLTEAPIERTTRKLHSWVAFLVLPLFALANAGVVVSAESLSAALHSPVAWGVVFGLLLGKPLGIVAFTWLATKTRLAELPQNISWSLIAGVGVLAGIGFTVSIFITGLAFSDAEFVSAGKLAILLASLIAGVVGFAMLRWRKSGSGSETAAV
jgi:Na+:H+ antiporter, NhaA family